MSTSLVHGTSVLLEGGNIPISGTLVDLDEKTLQVKVDPNVGFFPVGFRGAERFSRQGDRWRRIFPDPHTGEPASCSREQLYELKLGPATG